MQNRYPLMIDYMMVGAPLCSNRILCGMKTLRQLNFTVHLLVVWMKSFEILILRKPSFV